MHYFKKNIGDYAKKAGRLSMLQHGSYTLLLDACYDREQFPTLDEAIEWTWASTTEEVEAVHFVLKKFFTLEDGRYVQARVREEIAEYHAKAETNKRIALERETNRKAKNTNRAPVVNEPPPNHKPITTNQEPKTNILSEQSPDAVVVPDRRKPAKRPPSPEDESLAARILGLIHADSPSFRKPNLGAWADDIRLMREQDGRTLPEIWSLFQFVRKHSFWRTVVLSPGKLREKYDQLVEVRASPAPANRNEPSVNEKFNFNHLDRSGDARAMAASMARHGITVPADDEEIDI